MVFTVNSSGHTQKVVLSSRLGTFNSDGRTKFMLRTPIISPMNVVSMVNLESCVLQTPTYFSTSVLGSNHNAFDVYNAAGTWQYSVWDTFKDGTHTVQSNTQSLNTLLKKCVDIDMTNKTNLANFFCDFVTSMQLFKITFGNTSFPNQATTAPFFIQYGAPTGGNSVYGYTGGAGEVAAGTSNVTVANLAEYYYFHCYSHQWN